MSNTTFSISFYYRGSKVNKHGVAPLELCININQERLFVFRTKLALYHDN